MGGVVGVEFGAPKAGGLPKADRDVVRASPRLQATMEESKRLAGQLPDEVLTYPHGQRPVTGENRWLRFLYRGHRVYLRRAA